jgi:hypothetical protein
MGAITRGWIQCAVWIRSLGRYDDVRAVGPLTYALGLREDYCDGLQQVAVQQLTKLLPRMTARDAELLDPEHRATLAGQLTQSPNGNLVLAILKAFRHIGSEKELRAVGLLATGCWPTYWDPRVHDAAVECAGAMRERLANEAKTAHLLRPASAPDDTLLRPASAPSGDVDVLLRPAEQEAPRDGS